MRRASAIFALLAFCAALLGGAGSRPAYAAEQPAKLLFAEEFDRPALDPSTWVVQTPWRTTTAGGSLEIYEPGNVLSIGGDLRLVSERRETTAGPVYVSGIVTSLSRQAFGHGYFEMRAKLPRGRGLLPAFWLTQDKGLEIDAMEMLGDDPRKVYCTLHENGQVVFQHTFSGPDFSADYHTFGVDWQAGWVNWFVDGTCVAAWPEPTLDERVWICLDTGMGGPWPGPPDDSALPQSYAIDYVRVWDKMPDPGDPPPPRTSPAVLLGTLPTSSAEFVGTVAPDA